MTEGCSSDADLTSSKTCEKETCHHDAAYGNHTSIVSPTGPCITAQHAPTLIELRRLFIQGDENNNKLSVHDCQCSGVKAVAIWYVDIFTLVTYST